MYYVFLMVNKRPVNEIKIELIRVGFPYRFSKTIGETRKECHFHFGLRAMMLKNPIALVSVSSRGVPKAHNKYFIYSMTHVMCMGRVRFYMYDHTL